MLVKCYGGKVKDISSLELVVHASEEYPEPWYILYGYVDRWFTPSPIAIFDDVHAAVAEKIRL